MAILESLRRSLPVLFAFAWMISVLFACSSGDEHGAARERALGAAALAELKAEHERQRAATAALNLAQYQQQVDRANQTDQSLQQTQQQLADAVQQLKERISNVTTVYLPGPAAKPAPIPRCVFTAGWVRDFNLALGGAPVSAATPGTNAALTDAAAWPTPGSAQELLESGVTPADILAFAQDYGHWALGIRAQLTAFQRKD